MSKDTAPKPCCAGRKRTQRFRYHGFFRWVFPSSGGIAPIHFLFFPFLLFLSFLYAGCLAAVRFFYAAGWLQSYRPKAKVLSVGNITVGGSGKTPFVEYLARRLSGHGRRVAVLLRGYKKPELPHVAGTSDFFRLGDEGSMLKKNLGAEVNVVTGADRAYEARRLDGAGLYDIFVLDDGFQHWRLKRDLDIVIVDALDPFGRCLLLPAGLLREGIRALSRAHVFCISHSDEAAAAVVERLEQALRKLNPKAVVVRAAHQPVGLYRLSDGALLALERLNNARVSLLCGIGRPDSFARSVASLGACVVTGDFFEDHHAFSGQEMRKAADCALAAGAEAIVTTEKDGARLKGLCAQKNPGVDIWVLKMAFKILTNEKALDERITDLRIS